MSHRQSSVSIGPIGFGFGGSAVCGEAAAGFGFAVFACFGFDFAGGRVDVGFAAATAGLAAAGAEASAGLAGAVDDEDGVDEDVVATPGAAVGDPDADAGCDGVAPAAVAVDDVGVAPAAVPVDDGGVVPAGADDDDVAPAAVAVVDDGGVTPAGAAV